MICICKKRQIFLSKTVLIFIGKLLICNHNTLIINKILIIAYVV